MITDHIACLALPFTKFALAGCNLDMPRSNRSTRNQAFIESTSDDFSRTMRANGRLQKASKEINFIL